MNIVITGGSKGIGFAIAETFLRNDSGHNIVICSRSQKETDEAVKHLMRISPGSTVLGLECDVSDEASVARFVEFAFSGLGQIDVLVNNAGFGRFGTVDKLATTEWHSVIATNLRGVFLMTQALLPQMRKARQGTVVTISSLAGKTGFATASAYCAAKFAVRGMMQSLFLDVREDNIRVITIFPGSVDTAFFASAGAKAIKANAALTSEDVAATVLAACMLPQNANISEIEIRPTNPKG